MTTLTAPTSSSAAAAKQVLDHFFPQGIGAFIDGKVVAGNGAPITLTNSATG